MIDRIQESANKRERMAREQDKERQRQERRDRGEDSQSHVSDDPLQLGDLQMRQERSENDGEYEQINIGRFNFATSDISHRYNNPKDISIRD